MSFVFAAREWRRDTLIMLETLIVISTDFPPRTSSRASPHFFHGSNHHSYGFGSRENDFVPRCFGYGPHPHCGDRPLRRHDFPTAGSYTRFESGHLDDPRFTHHGSCPTRSNG
jgi:hypothetical protein